MQGAKDEGMHRWSTERENRAKIEDLLRRVPEIFYAVIARESGASIRTVIRIAKHLGIQRRRGRKKGR